MTKQIEFEKGYMSKKKLLWRMRFLSLEHIISNDLLKTLRVSSYLAMKKSDLHIIQIKVEVI
jgi:hypothetical protein